MLSSLICLAVSFQDVKPAAPESVQPARAGALAVTLGERLDEVLYHVADDGRVWARGRGYRAAFGPEGLTFLPVFGRAAATESPVAFRVQGVTVGAAALAVGARAAHRSGARVALDHGSFTECYDLDLDGVEQSFVFDGLPGVGALTVDLAVETELEPHEGADGLTFRHAALGHVAYGEAFALDAAGRRIGIERVWTGDGVRLLVPEQFVATATFPLVVDPRITAWSNSFGAPDDVHPDVVFDGALNRYWVVWEEYTSQANADVYLTWFDDTGAQGPALAIEQTNDAWRTPRVAFHRGARRLLVVASEEAAGLHSVRGQLVDVQTGTLVGNELAISNSSAQRKVDVDVGGDGRDTTVGTGFCVVWSHAHSPVDHDLNLRIVGTSGSFVTNIFTPDNSLDDTRHTTISAGLGRADSNTPFWTIAWMRDTDGDGLGSIEARRIAADGALNLGGGNFTVEPSNQCARPSVTSRLDAALVANGERPSVVAYEEEANGARQIVARVVTGGRAFSRNEVTRVLEDVAVGLDRRMPAIGAGRRTFYLAYSEVWHGSPTGADRDLYYCAGELSETADDVFLALSERHQNLAFTGAPEIHPAVALEADGRHDPFENDAAIVWSATTAATNSAIRGYTVKAPTTQANPGTAVGRQFCDANPNSTSSPYSSTVSAWMWLEGSQSLGSFHFARCVDVPLNSSGYLITSRTTAEVNLAGGGLGRLCLAGPGRYVTQVQSSGAAGAFSTQVFPLQLPTPNSTVSSAFGETWHFQYWHRDSQNGQPTSNFSNACSVTFSP